jgi:CYTH domain-containing protein
MTMLRQFLIAPSLARLIQRERGGKRVLEGYFPDRPHHSIFVQVEEERSSLILSSHNVEGSPEECAGIPLSQAQALLAVASGQVAYVRTSVLLGSHQIHLQQVTEPGPLCLLSVEIPQQESEAFQPLSWFGPEVSGERAYLRRRIALEGLLPAPEVELTQGALNSVLDLLENGFTAWPVRDQAAAQEAPDARLPVAASPSEPAPASDDDQDINDLGIENDVIRELARSLRPQRR